MKEKIPYIFLEEPDNELKCVICLDIARDPHQHEECGKLVCRECLERYGRNKPCAHCRTGGLYYLDKRGKIFEQNFLKHDMLLLQLNKKLQSSL